MKMKLGISPCPNDTVMFHHVLNQKDLPFELELHMEDVEALNKNAVIGKYDVTKLSFAQYFYLSESYELLDAGAALGRGCGPILISDTPLLLGSLEGGKIAIPGKHTTANFLAEFALKFKFTPIYMTFDEIEEAVLEGKVDAGVIIHENRFTYQDKGLHKVLDLGEHWEKSTGYPIPLGGIAVKRDLSNEIKKALNSALSESVKAGRILEELPDFVKENAQEMEPEVMKAHIDLYVNEFSENLGEEGKSAIRFMAKQVMGEEVENQKYFIQ